MAGAGYNREQSDMPKSKNAHVSIERINVTRTQEGIMDGMPGEVGTHEWHMRIEVNGQVQWWDREGVVTGGEYAVRKTFPNVPLDGGKLTIFISGWEQDDFGDTELGNRRLTLTPEIDCPYGAYGAWVTARTGARSKHQGRFQAEAGGGIEGDYDFRVTVVPVGTRMTDVPGAYAALVREKQQELQGYWVAGWEDFNKQVDIWRAQGLRLARIASSETHPGQPSFGAMTERTFLGVFETGDPNMPFWLLAERDFHEKLTDLGRENIRATDIFAYREGGTIMIGGAFDKGERATELVVMPREDFEVEWRRRLDHQTLIAIDSFSAGRGVRWFAGLFQDGAAPRSGLWVGADEKDFRRQDDEFRRDGLKLVDFCTYNEGGTQFFNGIWHPQDEEVWLTLTSDWSTLVDRIDFSWNTGRGVMAIDRWSAAAKD